MTQFRDSSSSTRSRNLLWLLLPLLIAAGCGIARDKPVIDIEDDEPKQVDGTILKKLDPGDFYQTWQMDDGRVVSFSVYVPPTYTEDKPVPLVVSLHHGPDRMTRFFGYQMLQTMVKPATEELDAIIVAPDVINKSWLNFRCEESVMALLNEIINTYNVDRDRIMVVGYSMGAEGAWYYASKHPDFFTAAIPISGSPPTDYATMKWSVPMLVIHSTADEIFPFNVVADAVHSLEKSGVDSIQLYRLDGISHYSSGEFVEPLKQASAWVKEVWDANAKQKLETRTPKETGGDQ